MDCFAEPVIGPRLARTRWLAMTMERVVIPGWSEGPDPESRDSGFGASHRPGM